MISEIQIAEGPRVSSHGKSRALAANQLSKSAPSRVEVAVRSWEFGSRCAGIIAATQRKIRKKRLCGKCGRFMPQKPRAEYAILDRKSTRLNSSHLGISYA